MTTQNQIERAFEKPTSELDSTEHQLILETMQKLDQGLLRVCSLKEATWSTHQWIKKAILLYFRIQKMSLMEMNDFRFFDKIPLKKWTGQEGVRVVPLALARYGSFIESGAILMPSYTNIGAYVGSGTMVDTWATVGSCAQIGKNVHLSGGVGIGGVLEPVQADPVIVEDECFIGSRCIVVEGVRIEKGAVLGAGVTLTASTHIVDVSGSTTQEWKGYIPQNSVVIPGSRAKKFPAGEFLVPCALIIGKRKASTDLKTSLTSALREFEVSV
jgi:2,3,4,5-tetrahydropyridine-2-carboxylate N-succinyltransferase